MRGWELDKIVKRTFLEFSGLIIFHLGIFRYQNLVSAIFCLGDFCPGISFWECVKLGAWSHPKWAGLLALGFTHSHGFPYQIKGGEYSGLPQQGILPISAKNKNNNNGHRCLFGKRLSPLWQWWGVGFFQTWGLLQTFSSLASIQAKTRGSEQNIQGIGS